MTSNLGLPMVARMTPKKRFSLVNLTVDIPETSNNNPPLEKKRPSRWKSLEFKLYWTVVIVMLPVMVWIPITLSNPSHPNFHLFSSKLSPGWILGRKVDNSDAQYRSFRDNFPTLAAVSAIFLLLKYLWTRLSPDLISFNLIFSFLFLCGLHGTSVIKIYIILALNYLIAKSSSGSKLGPAWTWGFNIAILFLNTRYDGYYFGDLLPALEFLDAYRGFYPRWYISFNITMLRLVSFGMDYHWACQKGSVPELGANMTQKERQLTAHSTEMYSFANYTAYILYAPLYIAGPIMTFNDFLWQFRRPLLIPRRTVIGYFGRFLVSITMMEMILHFMYVVAIKDRKAWEGDTPAQISMIGFWNLIIVWLKLLIPWRFFRLWSLMNDIDPPENMVRCMVNNYSTMGFWRSWHRSYNIWIVRYIYIPVGGRKRVFANSVLVFSFVALWHDLTFRLLAWGWLISLFIIPELLARHLLPASRYESEPWYRHVCALGAVLNMLLMASANLVGFVIGLDGIQFFLRQLFGTSAGLQHLLAAVGSIFMAVQLMFEYREEEMRHGIYRKC
ncbi:MBOAT, membrane-bound O-acyltransferase family-domain-containing protein [Mycena floridula]|nr:MBOAT, membrane-bound O-acyltransferase family-domain-containing protein [Mycena floridula]